MEAVPLASSAMVIFLHEAVGFIVSITDTIAEQVLELPLASVTVIVTLLFPRFMQEKLFGVTE